MPVVNCDCDAAWAAYQWDEPAGRLFGDALRPRGLAWLPAFERLAGDHWDVMVTGPPGSGADETRLAILGPDGFPAAQIREVVRRGRPTDVRESYGDGHRAHLVRLTRPSEPAYCRHLRYEYPADNPLERIYRLVRRATLAGQSLSEGAKLDALGELAFYLRSRNLVTYYLRSKLSESYRRRAAPDVSFDEHVREAGAHEAFYRAAADALDIKFIQVPNGPECAHEETKKYILGHLR